MKKFIFAIILLLFSVNAFAVTSGVSTKTVTRYKDWICIAWTWASNESGAVLESATPSHVVSGQIIGVRFVPVVSPVGSQPTDAYDVTLLDESGLDVLINVGANCSYFSTSTNNYRTPYTSDGGLVQFVNSVLSPVVANGGATKAGVIYLYVKE